MTKSVVLPVAFLLISSVLSQSTSGSKAGYPCVAGDKCEADTKCTKLPHISACVPVQTYRGELRQGLFGDCSKPWLKCNYFEPEACQSGVCITPETSRTCNSAETRNQLNRWGCYDHETCQDGVCKYGVAGSQCRTHWLRAAACRDCVVWTLPTRQATAPQADPASARASAWATAVYSGRNAPSA